MLNFAVFFVFGERDASYIGWFSLRIPPSRQLSWELGNVHGMRDFPGYIR